METVTKEEIYNSLGRPLSYKTRGIFIILLVLIIIALIVLFLLLTGYIKFGDPLET